MIETIALDFGNVVGFFDHFRTLRKLAAWTDMTPAQMYAEIYDGDLEDAFEAGRVQEAEFIEQFRQRCRLRCDHTTLAAAIADIFVPNEELCAVLPKLKQRYRLVLGSNTNPIHSRQFLQQFSDTFKHFHAVVLSHEVGTRKPGREFYQHLVRAGQCPPERCVFVDDLASNIEGARACGLKGVVYAGMPGLVRELTALGIGGAG
jgi:HAD superfamily hydrolase (TIGR01509 family)